MSDNGDILIIKRNSGFFLDSEENVCPYFNKSAYFLPFRALRKIARKFNFSFVNRLFYGKWKRVVGTKSVVILFDSNGEYSEYVPKYIKRKNKDIKIIFWYWNPVKMHGGKIIDSKYIDEIWTYNRFDAKKYKLKYAPQFYCLPKRDAYASVKSDLIFLGKDKGRGNALNQLKSDAESQNLVCNFCLAKKNNIKYSDYIDDILCSRCIVDLVPDQECGLTLRPLEALFYDKKLITNYEDIVNYDFYNKNNIFIIGKDNIRELADFIKKPYKKNDGNIIKSYDYRNWLEHIEDGESVKYD